MRTLSTNGIVSLFAGIPGSIDYVGGSGDGGPATLAKLSYRPRYVFLLHSLFSIDTHVLLYSVNSFLPRYSHVNHTNSGLWMDRTGNLYMAFHDSFVIRKVTRTGPAYIISLFAGTYNSYWGGNNFDNAGMMAVNTAIGQVLGITVSLFAFVHSLRSCLFVCLLACFRAHNLMVSQ